jgi:GWxTD domain-containing protein
MIKKSLNIFFLLFTVLCLQGFFFGQRKPELKAYLDYKQYYSPIDDNYVEFQLQFIGHSVKYIVVDSHLVATLEINYNVFDGDSLVIQDQYLLKSPLIKDSIIENFYDINRFKLSPGLYSLDLQIRDLNNNKSQIKSRQPFEIKDFSKSVSSSDILIAEVAKLSNEKSNFIKSGIHIVPFISNYFPSDLNVIPYYYEIYNTDKLVDSTLVFLQKIRDLEKDKVLEDYTYAQQIVNEQVTPIFQTIDISNLVTGRYELELTVVDRELNELSKSNFEFERSNNIDVSSNNENLVLDPAFQNSIDSDSVDFYLASLIPMANPAESKNIIQTLKIKNEEKSRKHIQSFWNLIANKNQSNPYDAWMKYKQQVLMVERLYKTNFQSGHETDRGRVYLKYGAPSNVVTKEVSPSEYPYEIWTYNKIGIFSNKRFLFYNPDLVNNAYRLLHSDMLGERKTPGWAQVLSKRNTNQGDIDNPNKYLSPTIGNNSQDLFRQY